MNARARTFLLVAAAVLALQACKTTPATPPESAPPVQAPKPAEAAPAAKPEPEPAALAQPQPAEAPKPPAIAAETSALRAESSGFWPAPESRRKTIQFSLLFGNESLVKSWKLDMLAAAGTAAPAAAAAPVKRFQGTGADRPASLSWDGTKTGGGAAPEGSYLARLSIDYGAALPPATLDSSRFVLSIAPPEPFIYADPSRFDPSTEGVTKPLSLEIGAKPGLARIDSWSVEILDPLGSLFRSFSGDWPAAPLSWDGRSAAGAYVEPGRRYTAILDVTDEFGHAAATRLSIPVSPLPYATERSSISPWTSGFSPNGDKTMDQMDFSLGFGNRDAVASWKLELQAADKSVARTWSGVGPAGAAAAALPAQITWDGRTDSGAQAPDGRYVAVLSIDYGKRYAPETARSPSFALDVTPPELSVTASPELFSPDGDGFGDLCEFRFDAKTDLARVVDWSVDVYNADLGLFARLDGPWPIAGGATWNGRGASGELVDSAEEYPFVARVRDEFGNVGQARGSIATDILAIKEGDRYRISVTSIVFKGFTADFVDLDPKLAAQNIRTLDRIAAKLAKFPGYRVELVGHAVMLNWDDPVKGEIEQRDVLIPLSNARAKAIVAALHDRGIEVDRMRTEGLGAVSPIVPDSDLKNRWKNRRVDFYLDKK